ncbi:HSF-type DNA-binding protein [Nitzschia inconspicua]|uniref:HSF-type DNA-binding protein n=1 Tax=Nitzschia inconspicua TaxID=303405 RepID=A0A9K3LSC5_9STRA|nr:HSF-type DNA-binding protein [Nitzschia inconspicua]
MNNNCDGDGVDSDANRLLVYENPSATSYYQNDGDGVDSDNISNHESSLFDGSSHASGHNIVTSIAQQPNNDFDLMLQQLQQQQQQPPLIPQPQAGVDLGFTYFSQQVPNQTLENTGVTNTSTTSDPSKSNYSNFLNSSNNTNLQNLQQTQLLMNFLQQQQLPQQQQQPNIIDGVMGAEGLLAALAAASNYNTSNGQMQPSSRTLADGSMGSQSQLTQQSTTSLSHSNAQLPLQQPLMQTLGSNSSLTLQSLPLGVTNPFAGEITGGPNQRINESTAHSLNNLPMIQANEGPSSDQSNDTEQLQQQLAILQRQVLDMQQRQGQQQQQSNISFSQSVGESFGQEQFQNPGNANFLQQQLLLQQHLLQNASNMMQQPQSYDMTSSGANALQTGVATMAQQPSNNPGYFNPGALQNRGPITMSATPQVAVNRMEDIMSQQVAALQNSSITSNMIPPLQQQQALMLPPQFNMLQGHVTAVPLISATTPRSGTIPSAGDNNVTGIASLTQPRNAGTGSSSKRKRKQTFPEKLMQTIMDYGNDETVAWLPDGKSFVVVSPDRFCCDVLSKVFKEAKYASFVRKLHRWGFVRLTSGTGTDCFHHPQFQKNEIELANSIRCMPRGDDKTNPDPTVADGSTKTDSAHALPSLAGVEKFIKGAVTSAADSSINEISKSSNF